METTRNSLRAARRLALWAVAASPLLLAQRPVKLDVKAEKATLRVGERARLRVTLLDAGNRPAAAPKTLDVEIVVRFPSNETKSLARITIPAGQTTQLAELPPLDTAGFLYIWAKQPELRLGGTFLAVRPQGRVQPRPNAAGGPGRMTPRTIPLPNWTRRGGAAQPPKAAPAPPSPASARYLLALRYSPLRDFLANGKDPVTVHAFVMTPEGLPNAEDVRVNLFDSSGTLKPTPLVVPANEGMGSATLTSNSVGEVKVEYLGARPATRIEGDPVLAIRFDPPITALEFTTNPQKISLVDSCDLTVRLVNEDGRPVATLEPRKISVALETGRGVIETKDITIAAGNANGRSRFTPTWWGQMTVAAATSNLLTRQATVQVEPPLGLLSATLLGGLTGGYLFFLRYRRSKKWRIPVGAVTGMVLYWALLLLSLTALPRVAVLNPISAFVIAVLGGWLGLEVFEPILQKLGLAKAKTARSAQTG